MSQQRNLQPLFGRPRTFPIRLAADDDETLQSYVHRLSARHDVPLGQTLSRLGLVNEVRQKPIPGFGIVLSDQQVVDFSFVSGLTASQTKALLLSKYSGVCLNLDGVTAEDARTVRKVSASQWAYFSGSHFCSECLKDSGGVWKLSWKLPWSFACTKHSAILSGHCPECGQRASSGSKDGTLSPSFIAKIPKPGFCGNVLPTGKAALGQGSTPCGCNLMDVQLLKEHENEKVFNTQATINKYLTPSHLIARSESAEFFREMRSLCALILYRAELEDFPQFTNSMREAIAVHIAKRNGAQEQRKEGSGRSGSRPRMFIGAPKDPLLMGAVAHVALSIVGKSDPGALREALNVLGQRTCDRSSKYRYAVLNYFDLSDRLRVALTDSIAARGSFDRRAGHLSNVGIRVKGSINAGLQQQYEPKHLPQCMPQAIFEKSFIGFFPKVQARFARRFCSLAAVKRLGYTWLESAELLGLPSSMYGMANRCVMLLNQQQNYDQFAEALYRWTEEISSAKRRIDYQRRREIFAVFVDFPEEVWTRICSEAEVSKGNPGSRCKYAATWLWSESTGGDWALAPAISAHHIGTNQHEVYKKFVSSLLPALAPALLREGKNMMEEHRIHQKSSSSSSSSSS
jgi:hypothetical protein